MLLIFCIVSSGSVTNFFPTVVETLNYNKITTLLLTSPPYVLAVLTTFLNARHADRTGERYLHITLPLYVSVIAFILAAATTGTAPRYLPMMLMVPGVYTGYVVALGWISNTLPRPPAKRAAAIAAINAVSNTSSVYASYMYPKSAGPRYGMFPPPPLPTLTLTFPIKNDTCLLTALFLPFPVTAMSINCTTSFIAILSATVLRFLLARLNRELDRDEAVAVVVGGGVPVPGQASRRGLRVLL